jgi:hypothetical protein
LQEIVKSINWLKNNRAVRIKYRKAPDAIERARLQSLSMNPKNNIRDLNSDIAILKDRIERYKKMLKRKMPYKVNRHYGMTWEQYNQKRKAEAEERKKHRKKKARKIRKPITFNWCRDCECKFERGHKGHDVVEIPTGEYVTE